MKHAALFFAAIVAAVAFLTAPTFGQASFQGLGDLDGLTGNLLFSRAEGVSGDGSVVAGWSNTGQEPFRWTEAEGMIGSVPVQSTQGRGGAESRLAVTVLKGLGLLNRRLPWIGPEEPESLEQDRELGSVFDRLMSRLGS